MKGLCRLIVVGVVVAGLSGCLPKKLTEGQILGDRQGWTDSDTEEINEIDTAGDEDLGDDSVEDVRDSQLSEDALAGDIDETPPETSLTEDS